MSKKAIKMRVVDWHEKDTEENFYANYFIKLLQEKFDVIYSSTPDFIIYGSGGSKHLADNCECRV